MEVRKGVHLSFNVIDTLKFLQVREYVCLDDKCSETSQKKKKKTSQKVKTFNSGVIKSFA